MARAIEEFLTHRKIPNEYHHEFYRLPDAAQAGERHAIFGYATRTKKIKKMHGKPIKALRDIINFIDIKTTQLHKDHKASEAYSIGSTSLYGVILRQLEAELNNAQKFSAGMRAVFNIKGTGNLSYVARDYIIECTAQLYYEIYHKIPTRFEIQSSVIAQSITDDRNSHFSIFIEQLLDAINLEGKFLVNPVGASPKNEDIPSAVARVLQTIENTKFGKMVMQKYVTQFRGIHRCPGLDLGEKYENYTTWCAFKGHDPVIYQVFYECFGIIKDPLSNGIQSP